MLSFNKAMMAHLDTTLSFLGFALTHHKAVPNFIGATLTCITAKLTMIGLALTLLNAMPNFIGATLTCITATLTMIGLAADFLDSNLIVYGSMFLARCRTSINIGT